MNQQYVYTSVSSYQVLQRDFATSTAAIRDALGHVRYLPVGGPYAIDNATDVMVGDVWVMAGQSNMEGNGYYVDPWTDPPSSYMDYIENSTFIHLFNSSESWQVATEPTHRLDESLREVDFTLPDLLAHNKQYHLVRGFSLGVSFAQSYRQKLDVPVGLVAMAHGGTTLEEWGPDLFETTPDPYNNTLYGAMMGRLAKLQNQIAGILWSQGESDTESLDTALLETYRSRMEYWIQTTRERLGNTALPFVYVQIGRHIRQADTDQAWSAIRQAQWQMNGMDGRVGAVASIDLDMDDRIHLSAMGQHTVGRRLAAAAVNALDNKAGTSSPSFAKVTFEQKDLSPDQSGKFWSVQKTLLLSFENVERWRHVDRVFGFSLHRSNGTQLPVIYSARIQQDQQHIRLYLSTGEIDLSSDVYLYYGYGKDPICNLETVDGMGLLAFGPVPVSMTANWIRTSFDTVETITWIN